MVSWGNSLEIYLHCKSVKVMHFLLPIRKTDWTWECMFGTKSQSDWLCLITSLPLEKVLRTIWAGRGLGSTRPLVHPPTDMPPPFIINSGSQVPWPLGSNLQFLLLLRVQTQRTENRSVSQLLVFSSFYCCCESKHKGQRIEVYHNFWSFRERSLWDLAVEEAHTAEGLLSVLFFFFFFFFFCLFDKFVQMVRSWVLRQCLFLGPAVETSGLVESCMCSCPCSRHRKTRSPPHLPRQDPLQIISPVWCFEENTELASRAAFALTKRSCWSHWPGLAWPGLCAKVESAFYFWPPKIIIVNCRELEGELDRKVGLEDMD